MRVGKWPFLITILFLVAAQGSSQIIGPAVFTPANPTDVQQIRAAYTAPGICGLNPTTVVNGTVVRTTVTVGGCVLGPPAFQITAYAFFGPLSAGNYTYELYEVDLDSGNPTPRLVSSQPLVVTAAVPALSPAILFVLLLALAGIGWLTLVPPRL